MPDYNQGKIYRLTCSNLDLVYYGSTTLTLNRRLNRHKNSYKRWLNDNTLNCEVSRVLFEAGDVEIDLVMDCPCESKRYLEEVEETFITNDECVNMKRAYMTKEDQKEHIRKYKTSEKGKEKNRESMRLYRQTDKGKAYFKEYNKQYKLKQKTIE